MYTTVSEEEVNLFNPSARIIVVGSSNSGKSTLVSKIIKKYRSYFNRVILIGAELPDKETLNVERDDSFNPFNEDLVGNTLLVFDDITFKNDLIKIAADVIVRGRHLNCSIIWCIHNIFTSNKDYRIASINASHFILLRTRDINQVATFGKTFLCKSQISSFVDLYKKEVIKNRYSYLLLDFNKSFDEPLSIRTNIANEGYEKIFEL